MSKNVFFLNKNFQKKTIVSKTTTISAKNKTEKLP